MIDPNILRTACEECHLDEDEMREYGEAVTLRRKKKNPEEERQQKDEEKRPTEMQPKSQPGSQVFIVVSVVSTFRTKQTKGRRVPNANL